MIGMLQIGERSARRLLGSRLRARQHEAVARLAGAYAAADREGRLPDPVDELRRRRVERVAAAEGLSRQGVANDGEMSVEDSRSVRAVETESGER